VDPASTDPRVGALRESDTEAARAVEARSDGAWEVTVVGAENGEPQPLVRVTAWVDAGAHQVGDPFGTHTDQQGRARLDVPTGRPIILIAHGNERDHGGAHVDVSPLLPGEKRAVTIRVPTRPDVRFVGHVLTRSARVPVAEVLVRERTRDPQGPATSVRTAADGSFELAVRSFAVDALRFEHPEHGTALLPVVPAAESSTQTVQVLLDAAGTIVVNTGSLGGSSGTLDVAVSAAVRDLVQPRGTLMGGESEDRRSASCEPGGRVELRPLPPLVPLALSIRAGGELLWRAPAPIVLQPGEVREIDATAELAASIEGRVTEQDGAAVVGLDVLLRRGVRPGPVFQGSRRESESKYEVAITGERGAYRFHGLQPGLWLIGPAPITGPGANPETDPSPVLLPILLDEHEPSRTHDIVLTRGLWVTGLVSRPDSSPAAGASVEGFSESLAGLQDARCDGEGRFVLGPLAEGPWVLRASAFGHGESESATTLPGTRDVVLTLRAGSQIEITAFGGDGQPVAGAEVTVTLADGRGEARSLRTGNDGKALVSGLPLAPHNVVVTSSAGEIAIERDLDLGAGSTIRIEIHLVRAGRAKVRYNGPGPAALLMVSKDRVMIQVFALTSGQSIDIIGPIGSVDAVMNVRGARPARTSMNLAADSTQEHVYEGGWK